MENDGSRAIAIVGTGAVLPDATSVEAFWKNVKEGRYSITEVDPARWDPKLYYDADRSAPDKTYSMIGGWVRDRTWDPAKWKLAIPPRVIDAMDESQRWAIACTRAALEDYGYPKRPLDADRTAVILGNAMAGEKHYFTALRLYFPEYAQELAASASFAALPEKAREAITRELHDRMAGRIPEVTEDTMPGELSNCIAGRIANTFNLHGPNYVVDAACASAMAAFSASVDGLIEHDFDVAVTGGIDRNMGASTYVKFCKIGALSATGTRPYAEGADGFVMGEGAAIFILKRLADAERDEDRIYAVIRGIGGASDGKGKGITAPNPVGQKLAIERGWKNAGVAPSAGTYMEGHGTSTTVGDVVEAESLAEVLRGYSLEQGSVPLGSVKSNIGHLKGAAGAAGILKAALALRDKVLPPSVHCEQLNSNIDFAHSPLYVNRELKPWTLAADDVRRAGVSAFGFGGTNFHVVMEEHIPHRLTGNGKRSIAVGEIPAAMIQQQNAGTKPGSTHSSSCKAPLRGALVIGAENEAVLSEKLAAIEKAARAGKTPAIAAPSESDLRATERIVIDYADATDLARKSVLALNGLATNQPATWKALRAQGIFRGHGPAAKVAFLYTGQGSQYVNMLRALRESEAIVRDTFAEADRVMTPLLGKPLSDFIFVDSSDPKAVAKAEDDLRQTEITQPAVLATDQAMTQLLAAYGIAPDMTMGHSLGEYGALVGAGALPFEDALEAVSARGRGMTAVAMNDNGKMAAVFAPIQEIERTLKTIDGYVVIANINSNRQGVIGGASKAVEQAMAAFQKAGYEPVELPVSHAFHTSIVAGAGVPLRRELERLRLHAPRIPVVANLDGKFYPMGADALPKMLDILTKQVASPVQFVTGLKTLYEAGARIFVEVGPKKALQGFAEDVLGSDSEVISIFTNHPKVGDVVAFNHALCALYAAGLGHGMTEESVMKSEIETVSTTQPVAGSTPQAHSERGSEHRYSDLGQLFAGLVDQGWELLHGGRPAAVKSSVVITGAALGLPGADHIFDDDNIHCLLNGERFIDSIPTRFRRAMVDKNITRLVKGEKGTPTFESINSLADAIKLAGRGKEFNLGAEFGLPADRIPALDRATQLAIAVGIDALRDAGIPLMMRYRTTSKGTQLPDRWMLPDRLRDDTGVIFASAFPGYDSFADEMSRYWQDQGRREQLAALESIRARTAEMNGNSVVLTELDRHIEELKAAIEKSPYVFDRRFLFRVLSMGHSQFAEYIGARGPNTAVNGACASTAQAISLAEDWIHAGRCQRVVVVSADDVTSDNMLEWIGAGFLATGAAATDELLEDAALPFDRRRHGMLIGMGAAGLVVESEQSAKERGLQPICEVLGAVTANSAFHGTRLDVQHIGQVMEQLVSEAERRHGVSRQEMAPQMVFVSHETYTPARGGSAAAEIHALRGVFRENADKIVIANTKGFTGHAMGAGIEDVVAVKSLETGVVPPVANFKEIDPELGALNLSKGGAYPVQYALRLAAGFGSQISMTLLRWVKTKDGQRRSSNALGYEYRIVDEQAWSEWLTSMTGRAGTELEVVGRTLRVPAAGALRDSNVVEMPARSTNPTIVAPAVPAQEARKAVASAADRSIGSVGMKKVANDAVRERVLALVAEKTGYPTDMLDLDLDLEADLGVDTVKQAEMFAAVREIYSIPRDENRKLRDYPTLAHVIRFVYEKRPDLAGGAPVAEACSAGVDETATEALPKIAASEEVKEKVLEIVAREDGLSERHAGSGS